MTNDEFPLNGSSFFLFKKLVKRIFVKINILNTIHDDSLKYINVITTH